MGLKAILVDHKRSIWDAGDDGKHSRGWTLLLAMVVIEINFCWRQNKLVEMKHFELHLLTRFSKLCCAILNKSNLTLNRELLYLQDFKVTHNGDPEMRFPQVKLARISGPVDDLWPGWLANEETCRSGDDLSCKLSMMGILHKETNGAYFDCLQERSDTRLGVRIRRQFENNLAI